MMYLWIFHNYHHNDDTIIIAAYTEDEARAIIDDYDSPYVFPSTEYELTAKKPFNKGVIVHIH